MGFVLLARAMKECSRVADVRGELDAPVMAGKSIGFVPTMGALHEGHVSLIRQARAENAIVVVSVFVNPMQCNDPSDLTNYPRALARDAALAAEAGTDLLFGPTVEEMYPAGFQTVVSVRDLSVPLEGVARGTGHFEGVATVVAKLFNIVRPTV